MKKTLAFAFLIFILSHITAQDYTQRFNEVFKNVNLNNASTGIIYERVIPWSNLMNATISSSHTLDTCDYYRFLMSYDELYRAGAQNTFLSVPIEDLKNLSDFRTSVVPIGILHADFNTFDTSALRQNLYFDADSILWESTNTGLSLFDTNTLFMASPLIDNIENRVCFSLNSDYIFENTINNISSMLIDFGDGSGMRTVSINSSVNVDYSTEGIKLIRCFAILQNGDTVRSCSKIVVGAYRQKNRSSFYRYVEDFNIQGEITLQNPYDGGFFELLSGNMRIYFAQSDKILRKPVLIVDGFDPENNRQFETNLNPPNKSLWEMLGNGISNNFGDRLLSMGYDVVLLDFPQGGAYIEQNAMVCIAAINRLNSMLNENGSEEQIVVVGPSMGGQITRYALAYMEQHKNENTNNGNHNCRLWLSFDSPHQGANISLGVQALVDYFRIENGSSVFANLWNNLLCCNAAQQMLSIHKKNGANAINHIYYQQMQNLRYPSFLRKIAIANGSLNNTSNGVADQLSFEAIINFQLLGYSMDVCIRNMADQGLGRVFKATHWIGGVIPIHITWTYTNNGNRGSVDVAPGCKYFTFDIIAEKIPKWIQILGLVNLPINNHSHCFMPTTSVLDFSDPISYATDISNIDLVSEGKIPFDSYWGPMGKNMEHISFDTSLEKYLINEIETYITGPREIRLCAQWPYAIHLPEDSVAEVTWLSSANIRVEPTNNPYVVNIVPLSTGDGWISAEVSTLKHRKTLAHYPIHIANNDDLTPIVQETTIQGQSFVINDERYLTTDTFCIENGKTMTVTGTLHSSSGTRIIVRPGGRLVVDGGVLTSACEDGMWEGIYVEGDRTRPQTPANQGVVELRNGATIENARTAIRTASPDYDGASTGGIVLADDAIFRNCRRAVEFLPYADTVSQGIVRDNQSRFNRCTFTVDNDNRFAANQTDFSTHVSMHGVKGVHFKACSFSNTAGGSISRGHAIYTEDAGFSVSGFCEADPYTLTEPCECPSDELAATTFSGFATAVETNTTGKQYAVTIDRARFHNNAIGIEINGNDFATVARCDFDLQTAPMHVPGLSGLYLNNCTGYLVEDNQFHRSSYSEGASVSGILVSHSGPDDNAIRRNAFSNLNYGVYAEDVNGSFSRPIAGLEISCNDFTGNGSDIYLPADASIRPDQGSATRGADNTFAGSHLYSLYAPPSGYRYFHSSGHAPVSYCNFSIRSGAAANGCESTFCHDSGISMATYQGRSDGQSPDDAFALEMAANASVRGIMSDTLEDISALADWYGIMDRASAKYALAETQRQLGKDNALTLQYIADKYLVSERDREEYENYLRFEAVKMGDWREATGEQLEELRRIAEKKSGRSSVMARGVLCFFFDECDGEDCLSSNTKSKGTESAPLRPCLVNGKEYSILNRIPCELKGENADNYSNALSCCINKKYKILSASVQTYHDKSYFQPQLLSSQDSVEGVSNIYVREDTLGRIYRYYPALDTEVVVCDMSLMPGDTFCFPLLTNDYQNADYYFAGGVCLPVDSVTYEDGRKVIHFTPIANYYDLVGYTASEEYFPSPYFDLQFIEGVGPTYGPFGYIGQIGMLGAVLCAHNEDSLVFMADTLLGCYQNCYSTGVGDYHSPCDMVLYPNPTSSVLNVVLKTEDKASGYLSITNLLGVEVRRIEVTANEMSIDVSSCSPGVYMVLYFSQSGKSVRKFVKF